MEEGYIPEIKIDPDAETVDYPDGVMSADYTDLIEQYSLQLKTIRAEIERQAKRHPGKSIDLLAMIEETAPNLFKGLQEDSRTNDEPSLTVLELFQQFLEKYNNA